NLLEALRGTSASDPNDVPTADVIVGPAETYTTISAALTSLSGEDKLVIVKPGVYSETLDNAKSTDSLNRRLFLIAEDPDPYKTVIVTNSDGIRSNRDLYLRGFLVRSQGAVSTVYGLRLSLSSTQPAPRVG